MSTNPRPAHPPTKGAPVRVSKAKFFCESWAHKFAAFPLDGSDTYYSKKRYEKLVTLSPNDFGLIEMVVFDRIAWCTNKAQD